ncbi:hypothetical protein [Alteriqipengyuania lutimaris]|uniref:hypothetical protein n=1 Tax=Alteriqipengyuania lutimaris TaxID=1538146 RepID=UPI0015F1ACC3|nr:hypothetical protein [Alteriqipengyuania lutimaris]MBB3032682.1 hypothetical protein [Alteriqipengyuania lutimaris]
MQIEISQSTWRRIGAGALVILAVLVWAWWDGGEEPLRPVVQSVDLPEGAQ